MEGSKRQEPMTMPESKRQKTLTSLSDEGEICVFIYFIPATNIKKKKEMAAATPSDVDMQDANENNVEKGIIDTLDASKVCFVCLHVMMSHY